VTTTLKSVDHIGQSLESAQLEANVMTWLSWGLLGVGAFNNVTLATPPVYGTGSPAKLRPVNDPRGVPAGKVWEGVRADWVWESGVPYGHQPTAISGVYVNNAFVPSSATGVYAHKVSYPLGQVVFNSPIPTGSDVKVEHSYRMVQVRSADQPWFQQVAFRSFRDDDAQFTAPAGSGGAWDILGENRVQLPAVVVESVGRVRMKPLEIGNHARTQRQDILFHVLTETPWDRKTLHDILVNQWDARIETFDKNAATYPLNFDGTLASGAMTYPQMAAATPWRPVAWVDVQSGESAQVGQNFYWTTVRGTFEFDAA
jgi:hypothetical protein